MNQAPGIELGSRLVCVASLAPGKELLHAGQAVSSPCNQTRARDAIEL